MTATTPAGTLVAVCSYDDLAPDLGVAALVDGEQIAVFLLADGSLWAVQNLCPFSGAHVISRGITGTRGDTPTIASPVYKQVFSLVSGECMATMDKGPLPGRSPNLATYPVTLDNGQVNICVPDRT
ncbi:MAG: nitrite reductase (NAD(P)H) small subunit [Actinobacteria bacterium HGW-Actinobacteria-8]|nr:MAG: nitrite reductase (NAD(P)H) small subunit [Actinobacteria bacterium HGW-Actinobacteria-8]